MKTNLLFTLLVIPFCIFAKTNDSCTGVAVSHPDMVSCIQENTKRIEDSIKDKIEKKGSEYSVNMTFYNTQRKMISERCSLYNTMDGQRSEFLENECELEGVSQFSEFLRDYMKAVDNY
ncbi:hypothetical protein JD793_002685 [Citrobacter braakii]|nr:hypothetical protein [Citrobacter braakii]